MSDKKKEAYDQVKMEQFKESSRLEGMTPTEALDELAQNAKEIGLFYPEQGITPNSWVVIEVNHEGKQFQKILSGWSGGYLHGDNWRLSSPIKEIDIESEWITATTESGSTYRLLKESQGLRMSNAGVYNQLKEQFGDSVEIVEL